MQTKHPQVRHFVESCVWLPSSLPSRSKPERLLSRVNERVLPRARKWQVFALRSFASRIPSPAPIRPCGIALESPRRSTTLRVVRQLNPRLPGQSSRRHCQLPRPKNRKRNKSQGIRRPSLPWAACRTLRKVTDTRTRPPLDTNPRALRSARSPKGGYLKQTEIDEWRRELLRRHASHSRQARAANRNVVTALNRLNAVISRTWFLPGCSRRAM